MRLPQRRWGQAGKLATYVAALASVGGSLQEDDDEEEEFACAASLPERWQRNRHYYTRAALYLPSQSPWARVCEMPIDSERAIKWKNYAMLELTGLNLPAFFYLLEAFECSWAQVWPPAPSGVGGRPRILDAKGALALGLASLHMVCNAPSLMLCFGLPPATLSEYLSRARLALDGACDDTSECDVTWPSEVEMVEGVAAINRRHPGLARPSIPCPDGTPGGCGMWADGFTARHIRPGDKELEKLSFNGHKMDNVATNLLVFDHRGLVRWAVINAPGAAHDSTVANSLYRRLRSSPEWCQVSEAHPGGGSPREIQRWSH